MSNFQITGGGGECLLGGDVFSNENNYLRLAEISRGGGFKIRGVVLMDYPTV